MHVGMTMSKRSDSITEPMTPEQIADLPTDTLHDIVTGAVRWKFLAEVELSARRSMCPVHLTRVCGCER